VDTDALDRVGVAALRQALKESDPTVIDELGKMELLSPLFKEVVTEAINSGKKSPGHYYAQSSPLRRRNQTPSRSRSASGNQRQLHPDNEESPKLAKGGDGLNHQ